MLPVKNFKKNFQVKIADFKGERGEKLASFLVKFTSSCIGRRIKVRLNLFFNLLLLLKSFSRKKIVLEAGD